MITPATSEADRLRAAEFRVLGTRIHGIDQGQAMAWIAAWVQTGARAHVVTINPEFVMHARRDPTFHHLLENTRLNVPDGIGVVMAGRLGKNHVPARITGVSLVQEIAELSAVRGWPIALIGGARGVAKLAADRLVHDIPNLPPPHIYTGTRDMTGDEDARTFLSTTCPRIVCVGFGAPHQEFWINRNVPSATACVAIGVGGAFDYLSGRTTRAPAATRAVGLEWAFRLCNQPSRWRRMRVLPVFAILAAREIARSKSAQPNK